MQSPLESFSKRRRQMNTTNRSRRDALKKLGLGTAALALSNFRLPPPKYKPGIALQLYTVRKSFEHGFEEALRKIADIGFVGVETYPLPDNITLAHAGKLFKDMGLKVVGMHTPLPVGDARDTALRMAEAFESDRVIYPGWPQDDKYKTADGRKHIIEVYNECATFFGARGLKFGLHNHWWEFEKAFGVYPFYYLLENLDKRIFFEIDTYWAKTGGLDPAKVVHDFGERAPLLHIKDGPAVQGDLMYKHVPAGEGTLDFPAIVKAGGEYIRWMIVEFDEYESDIFEGIRKSYTYLTTHGLAQGKG
jgi:sugar phosphate isomerase/epimerase